MLIDFTVSNWKSFAEDASLNLTASFERRKRDTLSRLPGFRSKKVVPIAAVYGGNASGKTNLFDALDFLRRYIIEGVGVDSFIPVQPFRLDLANMAAPSEFDITFLAQETTYRLQVTIDRARVLGEKLEILKDRGVSHLLYERDSESIDFGRGTLSQNERYRFVAHGTRANTLFLTNGAMQNIPELEKPYRWFRDQLDLVGISSRMPSLGALLAKADFIEVASETLREFDTGIHDIIGEDADISVLNMPPFILDDLMSRLMRENENLSMVISDEAPGDAVANIYILTSEGGEPRLQCLKTRHMNAGGGLTTFSLDMESSGTRRLVTLMPVLFNLFGGSEEQGKVYVVDELDRCFHSMLIQYIVDKFVGTCGPNSRRQLLFTTHDLLLMNGNTLRRDEMYIAQRGCQGTSELICLNEYEDLRPDRDLLRSYLDGRFGGVPMIGDRF